MKAFRPLPAPQSWELYTCHPTIHRLFLVRIFSSHPHDSTSDIFTILKISDLCWSSPLVLRLHNRTPSFFSQEFFAFWSQARHLLTSFPYSTLRLHSADQDSTFKKETSPSGCQVPSAKCQCSMFRDLNASKSSHTPSGHLNSIWPDHRQPFQKGSGELIVCQNMINTIGNRL